MLEEERESSRSGSSSTSQHVDDESEERYDDEEYSEYEGERMHVHWMPPSHTLLLNSCHQSELQERLDA